MFEYSICNVADDEIFKKQCAAIEKNISPLKNEKLLVDVDGTLVQIYNYKGTEIKVCSDHFSNEVYVKSEIELQRFFQAGGSNG